LENGLHVMTKDEPTPKLPTRTSCLPWLAGFLGALAAISLVAFYFLWQLRSPWGEISVDGLSAAQARWKATVPNNYRMRLRLVGPQASEMEITVRGGEPSDVLRDGQLLRQSRTWGSWTVDGLLQMIRIDLDAVAAEGKQSLYLNGEFDPANGLPRHYRRVKFDPPLETGWDVIEWTSDAQE